MSNYSFEVDRHQLKLSRITDLPEPEPDQGQAVIRVDQFAITANNITYGVAGDMIGYWRFFPAADNWGRIPVWGKGTVIDAGETDLNKGDEFYGYYPMSSYLIVKPASVSSRGFVDDATHRADLPPVYNQYSLMNEMNGFDRQYDHHRMVYFPLFMTGFVLDDYLFDNDFFGAENTILSSASSKTSISTAFQLQRRGAQTTGLTSIKNRAFVDSLGLYSDVVTYDAVSSINADQKTGYIDMAGNRDTLSQIHHQLGDNLVLSCGVGITHYESRASADPATLPGAKPAMFFAPSQIQKRNQDWGPEKFQTELRSAWDAFLGSVDQWISIKESDGHNGLVAAYETVLAGASPNQAYVVSV